MEPALAALLLRPAVPRNAERLITSAGKCNQVLLQRIDAEGVGDFVIPHGPIRTIRTHQEPIPVAMKFRYRAEMLDPGIAKVAENGGIGCLPHGGCMMRALPKLGLNAVAGSARFRTDIFRCILGASHRHQS